MAEEIKQEEKKCEPNKALSMIFKVILGLVFLVLGGAAIYIWRSPLLALIKGCVGPFLILAGVITLAIAKE
ncbi:MAG: hypothetical protein Q8N85_01810 [Candidatus Omnitrophota bacterium]|nr:hypothetical protein [Candidatus Omnitrophota bacterium]